MASPWLVVPPEQALWSWNQSAAPATLYPHTGYMYRVRLYVCVYIFLYFSLYLYTQKRHCKAEGRCLPGVSPQEGRRGRDLHSFPEVAKARPWWW